MSNSYQKVPSTTKVIPGDTIYSIAKKYNIKLNDILRSNPQITNPNQIRPGQIINLPNSGDEQDQPMKHKEAAIHNLRLEAGYKVELAAAGFTFPTSITFDEMGNIYVGESGFSYGPAKVEGGGKIYRIKQSGDISLVAEDFEGPLTGLTWYKGFFYVITGSNPGKVYQVDDRGNRKVIIDGLPTGGDHYTSNIIFDNRDKMYFGTGTFTNSSVVGIDNFMMGWLASHPDWHDIAPVDYRLRGINYESLNPFKLDHPEILYTGAFHPFGELSEEGEIIKGNLKANGVIYRANIDGSELEQYATGLRNPFALNIAPYGGLLCIDQGYDARGSRPVANAPDPLYLIREGGWYGWPDYVAGIPISDPRFQTDNKELELVLAEHPPVTGETITNFEPHAAAMQFDFSYSSYFGHMGDAFVAFFGSLAPMTGKTPNHPGHRVVRLNMTTGEYSDFLTSEHDNGHASIRPIDVKFNPFDHSLYVLDYGRIDVNEAEMIPYAESGALWRVSKS